MEQKQRYLQALKNFTGRVKNDPNVIALLLSGSLAYSTVWEKSDIDLTLLVRNGASSNFVEYVVDEDGIEIHLALMSLSSFKSKMQTLRGGEYPHSYLGLGKIIYTKDETLYEFFEDARKVGPEDAVLSFIGLIEHLVCYKNRAEKWITVFQDALYAQRFLQQCCTLVADMELLRHNEEPMRESVLRAQELNPELMEELYVRPSTTAMTDKEIRHTLQVLDDYLTAHMAWWSAPILKILSDGEIKTLSHLCGLLRVEGGAVDFLAEKGILTKISQPSRLFKNSRLTVEEVAYLYYKEEQNNA